MKLVVVDSDRDSLQSTYNILQQIDDFEILCFNSIEELNNASQEYELLLIDIEISDSDGIQYARNHLERNIVFITNRRDKMQDAFGPNIYGFIHKDDCSDKYKEIIEDVILRIYQYHKITLKTSSGLQTFELSEIIYLQYIDNRVVGIVYKNKHYSLFGYTLKDLEEKLGKNFIYIDRGTIINIDKVTSINKSELFLQGILQDFNISKRRRKVVKERLKNL